jgi:opacity protein-like surface antigen
MYKPLAILTAVLIGLPAARAQDDNSVRFGIKLSPNLAWLRPDTRGLNSNGSVFGYTFGLMSEFPIGPRDNYAFATGLMLTTVGGGYTWDYEYVDFNNLAAGKVTRPLSVDMSLRYVELPLAIKMRTDEIGYMRYYGQIGVGLGFNIRSRVDLEEPVLEGALNDGTPIVRAFRLLENEDFKDNTNLLRAALVVGAGVEYNFSGNTALVAGITFNNGFTNVISDVQYNGRNAKVNNNFLELTLGVFF